MSHIKFENIKDDPIRYWIRINEDIYKLIKDSKLKRWHEMPTYVEITINDPEGKQLVAKVLCRGFFNTIRGKARYSVFYIKIPYDTNFVIEGDLGRARNEQEIEDAASEYSEKLINMPEFEDVNPQFIDMVFTAGAKWQNRK